MVAVAAHEGHWLRSIGKPKPERVLVEGRLPVDIGAVHVDVGEPQRPIRDRATISVLPVPVDEADRASLRLANGEDHTAVWPLVGARTGEDLGAFPVRCFGDRREVIARGGSKRDGSHLRSFAAVKRKHMMIRAGGAQVDGIALSGRDIEASHPCVEAFGEGNVRRAEIDAAQGAYGKARHGEMLFTCGAGRRTTACPRSSAERLTSIVGGSTNGGLDPSGGITEG
jgi:hypothetical protein